MEGDSRFSYGWEPSTFRDCCEVQRTGRNLQMCCGDHKSLDFFAVRADRNLQMCCGDHKSLDFFLSRDCCEVQRAGRNVQMCCDDQPVDSWPIDQFVTIPSHSTLAQPRMVTTGGVNPLDLTSAIQHELRRANSQPWNQHHQQQQQQQQQQFGGSLSHASSLDADSTTSEFIPVAYGFEQPTPQHAIPYYIPRFDEAQQAPAQIQPQQQMPQHLDVFPPVTAPALYSSGSRSANGLPPSHPAQQVMEAGARTGESMRSCSPWIERMMQADVTPTPSPVNAVSLSTSLSLAREQRTAQGEVSCMFSQTVDSSDQRSAQSMRSAFSSEPGQHESTVELSADLCTDDDDLDTRPLDVKRKKRMLSNRASAQRSRQRRQERLDQLEVLTAKLRVENSALHKKWTNAMQVAKKFEDQNKDLLKKVDRLSKELEGGSSSRKFRKLIATNLNDHASSQPTACASSCEMVGERPSVDPNGMRDGNGASTTSSMSPNSAGWPVGRSPENNERDTDVVSNGGTNNTNTNAHNNNANHQVSPVRKSFSACRMEKKRSYEDTATAASHGLYLTQPRPLSDPATLVSTTALEPGRGPFWHELGLDGGPSLRDDFLEADRWLEFPECLL